MPQKDVLAFAFTGPFIRMIIFMSHILLIKIWI